jgi:hypothetical protein
MKLVVALFAAVAFAGTLAPQSHAATLPPLPPGLHHSLATLRAALHPLDLVTPPGDPGVERRVVDAFAVARDVWGPVCEDRGITVRWVTFDPKSRLGQRYRTWARTFGPDCLVEFNRTIHDDPSWRSKVYSWPWFCTLVVHEYGHLIGRNHSTNPASVMYPVIQRVFPACR